VTGAYQADNDTAAVVNAIKHAFVGGTYDFGVAKGALSFTKVRSDNNATQYKLWSVGATVPVSAAGAIIASYSYVTNDAVKTDNNSGYFGIGYTHSLSKRTNLYTSASRLKNDKNVNAGGIASGNGATELLYNVGIRHAF
jgi:predicted porin